TRFSATPPNVKNTMSWDRTGNRARNSVHLPDMADLPAAGLLRAVTPTAGTLNLAERDSAAFSSSSSVRGCAREPAASGGPAVFLRRTWLSEAMTLRGTLWV